ncbi:hypothetical protein M422DRAFT_253473 [Sphaerobolus stellatus SS14]|uniref:Reverse transcriptase/retrotransposon-derived protein RNase H-like domain-containing protein n=1 Tax=Sphaerobolus stellatus (strain SS14) TaxID=990650 RepID=A0A0C9VWQ8_SPHS4|nr:hypothetical protein M422DRAFT_253473 [Sphaerobolus stellatus SS14]
MGKKALANAPVRAYAILGLGYMMYTDPCDGAVTGILQQVQPIKIGDLKGTKIYEKLKAAWERHFPIPSLVKLLCAEEAEHLPVNGDWDKEFKETIVHIERVTVYWSHVLKESERNYSPTEKEALVLKDAFIKFQPYIEVFAAYPGLKIIHQAGRVHSNMDPVSCLQQCLPRQDRPISDGTVAADISGREDDVLNNFYKEISPDFEAKILHLRAEIECDTDCVELLLVEQVIHGQNTLLAKVNIPFITAMAYSGIISLDPSETEKFTRGYLEDNHFSSVLDTLKQEEDWTHTKFSQYSLGNKGLLFFQRLARSKMALCSSRTSQWNHEQCPQQTVQRHSCGIF